MIDAKETRAQAFEIKFVVDSQMGERIREWARTFLDADPHGTGPFGDEYRTSTLYFDTAEGHVFHRWGSYGRAKYRIRRYGDSDVAFLERKLRRPGMLVKRRTQVALHELERSGDVNGSRISSAEWFQSSGGNPRAESRLPSVVPTARHAPLTPARDRPALRLTSRSARPLYPAPSSVPIRETSFSPT